MIDFAEAEVRSRIIKAMAHPVRLMIVDLLQNGEKPFSEINSVFQFDKSTTSKHLSVLKNAGIVSSRKERQDTIYRLETPCVIDFFKCVTVVIENTIRRQQQCVCKDTAWSG